MELIAYMYASAQNSRWKKRTLATRLMERIQELIYQYELFCQLGGRCCQSAQYDTLDQTDPCFDENLLRSKHWRFDFVHLNQFYEKPNNQNMTLVFFKIF